MASGFIERVKAFITKPGKAFEAEHKTTVKEAVIYSLKGFLVLAILLTMVAGFLGIMAQQISLAMIPIMFFAILLGGFGGLLVASLWYHLWAYIFGARQGVRNTIKATLFSSTPTYVLGWIPLVNYITGIWSLILLGIGLKKLQKLSTGRAIAAVVIAVLIPLIIAIIVIFWLLATYGLEIFATNGTTSAFSVPY
jgi:hypothetical protein